MPPRTPTKARTLDAPALERAALRYLERFDATAAKLLAVLRRRIRAAELDEPGRARLDEHAVALVERFQSSRLIDDARYAESLTRGLRARGASRLKVAMKLRSRGVGAELVTTTLERVDQGEVEPELVAARALVARRRLGRDRAPEALRRDLGRLARAGFSFDVARRALAAADVDVESTF